MTTQRFKKVGSFSKVRRGASPRPIDDPKYFGGDVGWVRIADVTASKKFLRKTTQYVSELGEKNSVRVDKGDLIMSICGTIGRPVIIDIAACIHDGFVQLYDIKDSDTEFLYYSLQFSEEALKAQGQSGTQTNLNTSIVNELEIFHPSLEEQTSIATVLSCIDRAIEQTEALIAKQERIKTGLMQDLLTKGIDEHGNIRSEATHEFKDSRLGRIPKEWDAVPLKEALSYIDAGKSPTCLTRPAGAGEWGILKVSAIRPDGFKANENKAVKSTAHITKAYEVKDGDLLISRANTYELVGIVCFVRNPIQQLMLCDKTLRLNVDKKRAATEFLFHVLQMPSVRSQIEINATGSSGSMKNISQTTIESLVVPLPVQLEEQEMIIRRLNSHDLFSSIEVRKREKLARIKQGLMQDLLIGKVSVESLIAEHTAVSA
jgi:type I restriction enzyme, S subunit